MDIKKVLKDAEAAMTTYEWLAVTEFDATTVIDSEDARKVLYEALAAQLDAIIAEMENDMRHKDTQQANVIVEQCDKLKEARKELNNNH